jgi:two-component system CheB/CheR fusion protein
MGDDSTGVPASDSPLPGLAPAAEPAAAGANPGLVVGIGASAGGLEAYRSFFSNMRDDSGMAFVLVQHLSPDHKSMLAELVGKSTGMEVLEAADGMAVGRNSVFVIPPDSTMSIRGGRLAVARPAPPRDQRRPIDTFFASLAADRGENAIGIILSGTGSDGSIGVAAIKEQGGLTLAQAEFDHHALPGMPQSATSTGQVDEVLAVEDMPARLAAYQAHLGKVAGRKDGEGARRDAASHLSTIMTALRARTGHDFGEYKEKTLVRRLQRRMQMLQLDTPAAYIAHFREQPDELDLLFRELLIGVTQFFRDPAAFEALDNVVLKKLVAGKGADDEVRIWVPGCASGQEAYTIAILLREAMGPRRPRPKVQIFGTDIDEHAIAVARLGRYRAPVAGIASDRIERWFAKDGQDCTILPEIREMCVFSTHSVVKHPPFSRLDLISCRNLLIYVDQAMQDRIMRTFHYALKPGGHLFLGSSESATRATGLFAAVDKKNRLYARRETKEAGLPDLPGGRSLERAPALKAAAADERIDKSARRAMEKYYPPHLVVDRGHRIVHFSGGAIARYLEPSAGAPSFALFDILRKNLRTPVRTILQEARASGAPILHENMKVRIGGQARLLTLIAEPMADRTSHSGFVILAFQDRGSAVAAGDETGAQPDDAVQALEHELRTTRAQLQSTIDELEVTGEEMKSANEEFQSVNEELQSSNEELETSKEEMQSINEELQTINAEMGSKNDLLGRVNSDLKNLLESSEIATLFLDGKLRVRSFTPGVTEIFHVRKADIGRPITEIVSLLDYAGIEQDAKTVLRKLGVVERQVTLRDLGMTFIMRIRPYRTVDNFIDGLVLTFVDITDRDAADMARHEAETYLRLLIDSTADAIYCVDRDGATTLCNASFLRMTGFAREEDVIGRKLHDIIHHSRADGSPYPKAECPIYRTAQTGEPEHRDDEDFFRSDGTAFPVEYWVRPIVRGGALSGAVCSFVDISERRLADERQGLLLKEMDHRIKNLFAIMGGVVSLSARSAETPRDLARTIQGRLGALAGAHLLIRADKPGTDRERKSSLRELVETVLTPYLDPQAAGAEARASIEGPDVAAGGEALTSLALVLHELATNAAKYGALSVPGGRIRVAWAVDQDRLLLDWEEKGGPPVKGPPSREGFGSLLARRSVNGQLGGELIFEWHDDGLAVRLTAPLERLTS